jgi:hypothetical protein
MLSPIPQDRWKMIEAALKEKAPKTYQELKKTGNLQQFIANHDLAMMEGYDPMKASLEAMDQVPDGEYLRQIQAGYGAIKELDDQTLDAWLDFSDPPVESE